MYNAGNYHQHSESIRLSAIEALLDLSVVLVGLAARSIGPKGFTVPQYRTLVIIGGFSNCTVKEVSMILGVEPSTTSRIVARLIRKGFVKRSESPHDRRSVELRLTAKGKRFLQKVRQRRIMELDNITKELDPQLIQDVANSVRLLLSALPSHFLVGTSVAANRDNRP